MDIVNGSMVAANTKNYLQGRNELEEQASLQFADSFQTVDNS